MYRQFSPDFNNRRHELGLGAQLGQSSFLFCASSNWNGTYVELLLFQSVSKIQNISLLRRDLDLNEIHSEKQMEKVKEARVS